MTALKSTTSSSHHASASITATSTSTPTSRSQVTKASHVGPDVVAVKERHRRKSRARVASEARSGSRHHRHRRKKPDPDVVIVQARKKSGDQTKKSEGLWAWDRWRLRLGSSMLSGSVESGKEGDGADATPRTKESDKEGRKGDRVEESREVKGQAGKDEASRSKSGVKKTTQERPDVTRRNTTQATKDSSSLPQLSRSKSTVTPQSKRTSDAPSVPLSPTTKVPEKPAVTTKRPELKRSKSTTAAAKSSSQKKEDHTSRSSASKMAPSSSKVSDAKASASKLKTSSHRPSESSRRHSSTGSILHSSKPSTSKHKDSNSTPKPSTPPSPKASSSSKSKPTPSTSQHSKSKSTSSTKKAEPEKLLTCPICAEDRPTSRLRTLPCSCKWCHTCLRTVFTNSIKDESAMPPRCCTEIPPETVSKLFERDFKRKWNRRYQEHITKNRIYCPSKRCGAWIKPSHFHTDRATGRKYASCTRCHTRACVICKAKFHTSRDCPRDPALKALKDLGLEKGWQRCYRCEQMIELQAGCNHMTCSCGAEFCMVCAARWKTCTCELFTLEAVEAYEEEVRGNPLAGFRVDGRPVWDGVDEQAEEEEVLVIHHEDGDEVWEWGVRDGGARDGGERGERWDEDWDAGEFNHRPPPSPPHHQPAWRPHDHRHPPQHRHRDRDPTGPQRNHHHRANEDARGGEEVFVDEADLFARANRLLSARMERGGGAGRREREREVERLVEELARLHNAAGARAGGGTGGGGGRRERERERFNVMDFLD